MSEQYLNLKQFREVLGGRSVSSVNRDIKQGNLPQPVKLGRSRYWLKSAVDQYLTAQFAAAQQAAE